MQSSWPPQVIGDLTVRFPWHTPSLSTAEDAAEADAEAGEIDNQTAPPSRHSVSSGSSSGGSCLTLLVYLLFSSAGTFKGCLTTNYLSLCMNWKL